MSSTRNNNQTYEYACKKRQIAKSESYKLDTIFAEPKQAYQSFVLGSNPTKLNAKILSHNAVDVESMLRGIRSNDLENKPFHTTMKPKDYYTVELFENHLTNDVYLPRPCMHNSNERVGFHNI